MPKSSPPIPAFLASAEAFYGDAFDHKSKRALARSMTDWAAMDEDEQSFAQVHLLFLNLQAQAATQKLLAQVRDLLDEVAEGLTTAIEASLSEPALEGEEEIPGEAQSVETVAGEDDPPEEYEIDDEEAAEGEA